jgi:hypothetical protein
MIQFQNIVSFRFIVSLFVLLVTLPMAELKAACNPPTIRPYSLRTTNSIQVNWINTSFNDAWELELVKKGENFTGIPTTPVVLAWSYEFSALEAGTEYCFNIRSICGDETGDWNGPFCFITSLSNQDPCGLDFEMEDQAGNNPKNNFYYLMTEEFEGMKLGEEVFIQHVELIVEHGWPSDLEAILIAPNGESMVMVDQEGFNSVDFGIPDEDCQMTLRFSDNACLPVEGQSPLVGSFRPQEPFDKLYDGQELSGNWILNIRDHNPGHRGILQFFRIKLVEATCRLPQEIYVLPKGPTSSYLQWVDENHSCDSIIVEYGLEGFMPGSGELLSLTEDENGKILDGLQPSTSYEFYFRAACGEEFSEISCPFYVETDCHDYSTQDDFDDMNICELECNAVCKVSDIWYNHSAPFNQWLINEGMTPTETTGPDSDFSGFGKYIYVESSENNCDFDNLALLETDCMEIRANGDACDFSFYYHMRGPDIGRLSLEISTDDGGTWTELFTAEGDQGVSWLRTIIDLSAYDGLVGRFRFSAELVDSGSDRGDIALDELIFYGTSPVSEAQYLFYPDEDGDDYGSEGDAQFFCSNSLLEGFSRNNLDCDDTNEMIYPNAEEIPCNGIDENCNGMEDDLDLENPLLLMVENVSDESCLGAHDGSISLEVEGGQAPYQFNWSNGSTDSLLTGVGEGTYSCEIRDAFGCIVISDSFKINAGESVLFELVDKSIISCGGAKDGSITIDHTGGIPPYTYNWSNGANSKNIEELEPGLYQVTITDSLGCQSISPEIELIAATNFIIGLELTPPLCKGDDNGRIKIIGIQNGEGPFSYEWSNGGQDDEIDELEAGAYYHLTVTDASFCYEVIDSIYLEEPEALSVDIIGKDDISCYAYEDGAIVVNARGGTSPYTFQWTRNGQVYSAQDDLFQIGSGVYQLRVRDNNACAFTTDEIILSEPDPISIAVDSIIHADCKESMDGSISVNVSGGSGEYQYFWNGTLSSDTVYTALNPGLYNVVVTDRYGCKGFRNGIEVDYKDIPLNLTLSVLDTLACFGEQNASLLVEVLGAQAPLDYNWSAGVKKIKDVEKDTLGNLAAGTYNVTVTDAEGCVGQSSWKNIEQPDRLTYEIVEAASLLCSDDETGSIQLDVQGGISPYAIGWNNGDSGSEIQHLPGGYYSAVIQDANDCILIVDTIFLYEPDPISVVVSATPSSPGANNGSATVLPSGGSSPYYYQWDEHADFQITPTAVQLDTGTYFVTVTDFHQCEKKALVIVPLATNLLGVNSDRLDLLLFPNPGVHEIYFECPDFDPIMHPLNVYNAQGESVQNASPESTEIEDVYRLPIGMLRPGIYWLSIKRGNEHLLGRFIKIQ